MAKRITSLLLVIVLLAGMIPSAFAAGVSGEEELPSTEPEAAPTADTASEESPAETDQTESPAVEETVQGSSEDDALSEDDSTELAAVLSADDGIALLSSVSVSTDKMRQIQWIGHSNGHYNTSYYDAQGVHHTGYISAISIHRIDNKIAYCIQPTVTFGTSYTEDSANSAWMSELTANQRTAIALAIAYGYPNMDYPAADPPGAAGDSSLEYPLRTDLWQVSERVAATQLIVWEIVMGKRSATAPYNCIDTSLFDSFYRKNNPYGYRADWETLKLTYDSISAKMANHKTVPSFSAATSAAAPTHMLKYNSSTGKYTITLTDSNGVLSDYNFTSSVSGITFTRSGNTLTITATPEAAAKLATAQTASATGSSLEIDVNKVVTVWAADGTGQTAVQVKSSPDPVTAYLKLKAEVSGTILLKKTTNTGTNLSGWKIGLYTDAACTKSISGSPFTTGSDGTVTVPNLAAGTYYAEEQAVSDRYWVCDSSVKTVQVEAGKTATVTFSNTYYGDLRVKKTAVNGSPEGWNFQLLDAKKQVISTITTGADGYAYSGLLLPGTYYVREVHDRDETYWSYDVNVEQKVTVTAGTQAQVEFTNEQFGRIEFRKTTNTGNHLSGWTFQVTDANGTVIGDYTTDSSGYACTGKLTPGRYYVQELSSGDPYWVCDVSTHTVDVTAGKTVGDSWTNTEQGKGVFHKETNTGENLEGWNITIYSDEACIKEVGTVTTGADGSTACMLEPGMYYAKETGDKYGRYQDEYWVTDNSVQAFEIKPQEDTVVSFLNTHYGKIRIVKAMDTDGPLDGWQFEVYREEESGDPSSSIGTALKLEYIGIYTSAADGTILTGNLEPGVYVVREIIPEDSLFYCKTENPQTVMVSAGQTAEVKFTNALRPGRISIQKVDVQEQPLAGASFMLEWSDDGGNTWQSVTYSDNADVVKGGCGNANLADGCLTSGEDGVVEWSNLYPGIQYRITEVEAPEGYNLLTDYAFVGELPTENLTVSLRVVNTPVFTLPQTGSKSLVLMPAALALCLGVCIGTLLYLRKKKN